MESLVDLLEGSASRYGDRNALGLRRDDGTTFHWSYTEVLRRSRLAAWRLRALGLQPGDRVLTWSPSTPALPAAYYGAMRAGLIFVPLDARMAPDTINRIVAKSGAVRLLLGSGRDAPDPREVGLDRFPNRVGRACRWHVDDTHRRAGFGLRFGDAGKDGDALEVLAGALGVDTGDETFASVGVVAATAGVELARLAGDALRDDAGVLVDEDAHAA